MRLPREKTHVKTVAFRAVLRFRDRLRLLVSGRVAVAVKMTAPRWMPAAHYEVSWLVNKRPVIARQRIGFNRDAFRDPDEPSGVEA